VRISSEAGVKYEHAGPSTPAKDEKSASIDHPG